MLISFKCTCGRGFVDACFDESKNLQPQEIIGTPALFLNHQLTAMHACLLCYSDEGKLCCVILGLGRRVLGEQESRWYCGNDTKIMNIVFTEETASEKEDILSIYFAFCKDYFTIGNALLEKMLTDSNGNGVEYSIEYEEILEVLSAHKTACALPCHTIKENWLISYYAPCRACSFKERLSFCDKLKEFGITAKPKCFLTNVAKDRLCFPLNVFQLIAQWFSSI